MNNIKQSINGQTIEMRDNDFYINGNKVKINNGNYEVDKDRSFPTLISLIISFLIGFIIGNFIF